MLIESQSLHVNLFPFYISSLQLCFLQKFSSTVFRILFVLGGPWGGVVCPKTINYGQRNICRKLMISPQSVSHAIPSRQSALRQNPRTAPPPPTNHEAEKEKNK